LFVEIFLSLCFVWQQLVETYALFDQHKGFSQDQVLVVAGLRQWVFELEFELARRQSLESEVARLSKLISKQELELAIR
jgi:hypothetical protein